MGGRYCRACACWRRASGWGWGLGGVGLTSGTWLAWLLSWQVLFCMCSLGHVLPCGGLFVPGAPGPRGRGALD